MKYGCNIHSNLFFFEKKLCDILITRYPIFLPCKENRLRNYRYIFGHYAMVLLLSRTKISSETIRMHQFQFFKL